LFDLLIELFLGFLEFLGLKKIKKKVTKSASHKTNDLTPKQDTHEELSREGVSVCAGCNRVIEKNIIYELGKSWCPECYKTRVLKIKG